MFRIGFHGLIIHASAAAVGRDVAVVVNADQHTPLLMVKNGDVVGNPTLLKRADDGTVSCYNLLGTVTLTNLPATQVDRQLFGVPKLSDIVVNPGAVRDEVISQTPHADFLAYVNLGGGVLRVDDFFAKQATFDGTVSVCVPRTILYETEPFGQVQLIATRGGSGGNPGLITLQPTAAVSIGNIEPTIIGNPATPQEQYNNYLKFFKTSTSIYPPIETVACSHASSVNDLGCLGDSNLGVECSNSQFP